ncbi:MAG: cytochrome C biogenesis protein [Flavobacteriales bacterium]|nr:MAG: cytochrome C biogenesis protein [Flavobacteriales bacterium]
MEEIKYIGEHLWAGNVGNLFVIIAFSFALLSTIAFFFGSRENEQATAWKKIGRTAFWVHASAVIFIILTLFYMLLNQMFEYHYVWQHSNAVMPVRYIFSCFWEGQEGSFLLWMFWHMVLGLVLMYTSKNWQAPVMTVLSSVQIFLAMMLLGIFIDDYKIGSSPFNILLREHLDFANIPLFQNPNYLDMLDGRGLNPLLQNYWMTIHPPTLFLGFATTLPPFCFAIAGLWKKRFNEWTKPAIPWAYFGVGILGLGILMGGAWAYEALSFGGFWAWDPVENASLVPWITFVAAAHVMMIHKNKGSSLVMAFFLTIITFIFILYSTFLTRSGILGDTSVHAFTDLGMSGQLLIFLLGYLLLGIVLLITRAREIPKAKEEEALWSREFWMLIGAIVLFCSAIYISALTSYPVINKILGTSLAIKGDVIEEYHKIQIPIAIIVALLMGFTVFLKYKKTDFSTFIKKLNISLIISLIFTASTGYLLSLTNIFYLLLLFTSSFAVFANIDYFFRILKGKIPKAGMSIAHIGFGLMLLGALISMSKQEVISSNTSGIDVTQLGEQYENHKNILMLKDDTLKMGDYSVSYKGKEREGINVYYEVEYMKKDEAGKIKTEFSLFPRLQLNPKMGNVAEPDTRHFLHKDIYTHVTYAEIEERETEKQNEYSEPKTFTLAVGDSMFSSNSIIVLESFNRAVNIEEFGLNDSDIAVGAQLSLIDKTGETYDAQPIFVLKNKAQAYTIIDEVEELGLRFSFEKINPEENTIDISVAEKNSNKREFIVMKAIIFPGINILWCGCILMVLGTVIAVWNRIKR